MEIFAADVDITDEDRGDGQEDDVHRSRFGREPGGGGEGLQHMGGERLGVAVQQVDAPCQAHEDKEENGQHEAGHKAQSTAGHEGFRDLA